MTREQLLGRLNSVKLPKKYDSVAERLRSFCTCNYDISIIESSLSEIGLFRGLLDRLSVLYLVYHIYPGPGPAYVIQIFLTKK